MRTPIALTLATVRGVPDIVVEQDEPDGCVWYRGHRVPDALVTDVLDGWVFEHDRSSAPIELAAGVSEFERCDRVWETPRNERHTALTAEQLAVYGLFGGLCVTCGSLIELTVWGPKGEGVCRDPWNPNADDEGQHVAGGAPGAPCARVTEWDHEHGTRRSGRAHGW